jgi:hypothetical protein
VRFANRFVKPHESLSVAPLLDRLGSRGFAATTVAFDRAYDNNRVYAECGERGSHPIIPLRKTPDVKRDPDSAPRCEHGRWRFAGADFNGGASKWRCPTGECQPKSKCVKADRRNPLVPRETRPWRRPLPGPRIRGNVSSEG